jgi:hypothetical protein
MLKYAIPSYIQEAGIVDTPLTGEWNDDQHPNDWAVEAPALQERISKICDRGIVALCAGIAEWAAWRLSPHTDDRMLFQYIEAVRAGIVDWSYLDPERSPMLTIDLKDWTGPVRRSLAVATLRLGKAVDQSIREEDVTSEPVFEANLVERIIPDRAPFRKWRDAAIVGLKEFDPMGPEPRTGRPVPREVLDPNNKVKAEDGDKILDQYLKGLDYTSNPYLRSPDEMRKAGFKGTPYKLEPAVTK